MEAYAILLAAGSSRRFGSDKLLAKVQGKELYRHALEALLASPLIAGTIMVIRPGFPGPENSGRLRVVVNPDHEEGMASSLRAGVRAAPERAGAYLIVLADMPGITAKLIADLLALSGGSEKKIFAPSVHGRRGHPVLFKGELREELLRLGGDVGAKSVLDENPEMVALLETDETAVLFDVDRPEDLGEAVLTEAGKPQVKVLIKGAGELASATGHRLFKCGFRVAMTDLEQPTAVRRSVSFCSALYDGEITIEGVRGVAYRCDQFDGLDGPVWDHVPVAADPAGRLKEIWRPDVIIDGRMLKRNSGNCTSDAGLVIGLGPGLEAGRDVHFVVETHRGHDLGRIITAGMAAKDTGQPGEIGGFTHERVLTAPAAGTFDSVRAIGDLVRPGESVGDVAGVPILAGIAGVLRGLLRPGLSVEARQKLGDIDPRGDPAYCKTLSDKARNISGSVLEIVVGYVCGNLKAGS